MVTAATTGPAAEDTPDDVRALRRITLKNFLSFGAELTDFELRPLNLLIGPNGAGKSNFIEALVLLRATRGDLDAVIRQGGGVREWLWRAGSRNAGDAVAMVGASCALHRLDLRTLRHRLFFGADGSRFRVLGEAIHDAPFQVDGPGGQRHYLHGRDGAFIRKDVMLDPEKMKDPPDATRSILAQRRDPEEYPELTALGDTYERIRIHREWTMGRASPLRAPQRADMPNDSLLEDGTNLGMVLNAIYADHPAAWTEILDALRDLLDGFENLIVKVEAGSVQLFIVEHSGRRVPATRLSDGTLRFLCLLAVLCHPNPPPLVVIEEPELGLHPDAVGLVAKLLRRASERMQLVVTTHSDALIDAFTETPEDIVVVERASAGTTLRRLDPAALSEWLKEYRLAQLWSKGVLGGNRWG